MARVASCAVLGALCAWPWSDTTSCSESLCVLLPFVRSPAARDDEKDEQGTETGCQTDDKRFVVIDPGSDLAAKGGTFALTLCIVLV